MIHSKRKSLLWLSVLATLLVPLVRQATPAAADGWVIECVDCRPKPFSDMTDRSLRLDAEEHPHIAYGGDHLYYAWHDGANWHYETVDDSPGVGQYASLALDGGGYPHISYQGSGYLKYAHQDASGWHIVTVDTVRVGYYGGFTSLALDGGGYPHIGYYDDTNEDLKYAYNDASGWHIETVDTGLGYYGGHTSLALDEGGYPHIGYSYDSRGPYYSVGDLLKYAYQDASGWHIETVDSGGDIGWYTSLALDEGGYPHIGYGYESWGPYYFGCDLKYAYKDAVGWHIKTVGGGVGRYISLALDGNGYPHISYEANKDLKYAYQDASGWHVKTVDSEGFVGLYTSLALDGGGYPHISYYHCGTDAPWICDVGDLKYAYQDTSGWHVETVDSRGSAGMYTSLALDGDGYPHISYYGDHALKYAYQDASGWHIEAVDSEGDVGLYTSLALDRDGHPHISYYDDTNEDLKYAYNDASGWYIETVDTGLGSFGGCTSLALDRDGYPHISYHGEYLDLKYAYQDASGWHVETVDSEGDVGDDTSLALDEGEYPHISYFKDYGSRKDHGSRGSLKYAFQDASGWHVEIVDRAGIVGTYTSLALDGDGYPHISYCDWDNDDLRHAYRDASGWHVEIVDSQGWVGAFTSLALSGGGYLHISYFGGTKGDLKYAYQDASGWHIETVDSEGYVGGYTSLDLDVDGYPHISYYDYSNADLKYVYAVPWFNWRDPDRPLLLPPGGTMVDMEYGNILAPATLTATLSGSAIFADSSQVLTVTITCSDGSYSLYLKPAAAATHGDTFTLEVTLADLRLERTGAIAWEVYLPLILKKTP